MYHSCTSIRPPIGSSQATAMTNTGPAPRTDKIPVSKGRPTMVLSSVLLGGRKIFQHEFEFNQQQPHMIEYGDGILFNGNFWFV
jgi:hypothetical protein